jgi:hypothetical protein
MNRQRAIAAIEELGGTAEVDNRRTGQPIVTVCLGSTGVTDLVLKNLVLNNYPALAQVEGFYLRFTKITDAGLAHLRELRRLRHLDLGYLRVTDVG